MRDSLRVSITQPYLPKYRVPLFNSVVRNLASEGIEARVFLGCGAVQAAQIRERGDAATADWAEEVPVRSFASAPGRNPFIFRQLPSGWDTGVLVTEMQVANLNAWRASITGKRYVTIGHGKEYIIDKPRMAKTLETFLNRRAVHVLTYTEAGRRTVLERTRLPLGRVSAFRNATDTRRLSEGLAAVTDIDIADFRTLHGIPERAKIALFIGALEKYKRLDLLAEAFKHVLSSDPSWWLVVAGEGSGRSTVESLREETGRVTVLGHANPETFVVPAKMARVLLNPGRVGLIAVDALALNLPLLTTTGANHAPEAEYLMEGSTMVTSAPSARAFSDSWLDMKMPADFPPAPTVEQAAWNISSAILGVARSAVRVQ